MNESTASMSALSALITFTIAYAFFYWIWRDYVVDVTRQQLFELRDQLFDMATEGKLNRASEVYLILRRIFNSNIRFAHEMDWVHIVTFYVAAVIRKGGVIFESAMYVNHLIKSIEEEKVRHEVQKLMLKMYLAIAWHLYRTSLVLIVLTPIVLILAAFFTLSAKLLYRTPKRFETLINARTYSAL